MYYQPVHTKGTGVKTYSTREAAIRNEIIEPIISQAAEAGVEVCANDVYVTYDIRWIAFSMISTTVRHGPLEHYRNGTDDQFWACVEDNFL